MTALAGVWRFDDKPGISEFCARLLAAQEIYGPHASAHLAFGPVAFGRCLMRTLPEDAHDHQPLSGGGGRYMLVADVRLDNRDELCGLLNIPPGRGAELCDAAILLAAIERWGTACLVRVVGDYAFALWDSVQRRLTLARDPLGQRPLYYHRSDKFFAFASMPKGLYSHPDIPFAPNEERIAESLLLPWELGPSSFFKGIERVKSGHIVEVAGNSFVTRRHWCPKRRDSGLRRSDEFSEALRGHLDRAVRCRLRGAKDVGAHLSSGFDSSAVAATAARLLAPTDRKVVAFTAVPLKGFNRPPSHREIFDEGSHAAAVAALYPNMEHVLVDAEGRSMFDGLERNFYLFDEPTSSVSNGSWWYAICDAARSRGLRIVLTGQEGNMGLSYNGLELFPELFRRGRWLHLYRELRCLVTQKKASWRGALAMSCGPWMPDFLWNLINRIRKRRNSNALNYTPINSRRYVELNLAERAKDAGVDLEFRPSKDGFDMRLWNLFNSDPGNSNKGVLGGWHIDQRDPTADIRLIEFCLSVPTEQFYSQGVSKALARRTLSDRLPKQILGETRRGVQSADWFVRLTAERARVASELARLDTCPQVANMLDLPRLHRLVDEWPEKASDNDAIYADYRATLLRGLSTGIFLRRIIGSNA